MIRFTLQCDKEHAFEGWFASNEAFDGQVERGLLDCPFCGSRRVEKALMAPSVVTGRRKAKQSNAELDPVDTPAPEAAAILPAPMVLAPEQAEVLVKLQELSRQVRATTENVGKDFAEEARKIHFGEVKPRAIYGEATANDVEALIEDGVAIAPLAPLPEDRN
jgi:hypothetical protein